MKPEFRDLVELVKALAWPLTVIAAVALFRQPLGQFVSNLGQRVKKFSIFEFALELSAVPEFTPSWSAPSLSDVRQPSPADQFSSNAMALFDQIRSDRASDYAVIDLGTGQQWLTSRLFIFAVLLQRMRALQCFVFVETVGEARQRFIGMASPEGVRWGLARRYPWLEQAFAQSYGATGNLQILSDSGALETWAATQLVQSYLQLIQQNVPPNTDMAEWVTLGAQQTWEHAKWIDAQRLERVLHNFLDDSWILDAPDVVSSERTKAVLRRRGSFVASLDQNRKFRSLVDRQALLEALAGRFAAVTESDSASPVNSQEEAAA